MSIVAKAVVIVWSNEMIPLKMKARKRKWRVVVKLDVEGTLKGASEVELRC
jgi:hypothetical protein